KENNGNAVGQSDEAGTSDEQEEEEKENNGNAVGQSDEAGTSDEQEEEEKENNGKLNKEEIEK
ncbi:MAG: hypothetical protein JXR73_05000, partial [Candidatus Omnitrophica bacterium]|nr:hypothetical protein [Candidatus Omnitrophota bacterium]